MLRAKYLACLCLLGLLVLGCADGLSATSPTKERAEVSYVKTDKGRFAYYERGKGRPLLLLTGTGSTMSEWDPALLDLIAKNNRLILIDYLGVGLSGPAPSANFTFADVADQVAAFLKTKEIAPVNILGWSMGGFVAQQLAINHPGQVSKLIVAGSNPGGRQTILGPKSVQRLDSDGQASDREVLKELYPRTRAGQREGRAFLRRLERASESGLIPDDFRVSAKIQKNQVRAEDQWLRSEANWNGLAKLDIALLACAGREDRVTPAINMRRIASHAKRGSYHAFTGSHAFLFSDRVNFAKAVDAFLSQN